MNVQVEGRGNPAAVVLAMLAAASIVFASVADAADEPKPARGERDAGDAERLVWPDQVVVKYEPGTSAAERADARAAEDAGLQQDLVIPRAEVVDLAGEQSVAEGVEAFAERPDVAIAEPNFVVEADAVPNDPYFGQGLEWGLHNTGQAPFDGTADADVDAPEAWDVRSDASGVVVAVVDTGIAYDSPEFSGNLWQNSGEIAGNDADDDGNGYTDDVDGFDFKASYLTCTNPAPPSPNPACSDEDPRDEGSQSNHGTHVAGTIAARGGDGYGVTGVAQRAQLMPLKVFDEYERSSSSSVAEAFRYARLNGADVVNASLGGPCPSALQYDEIAAANNPSGTLFVVSAGNGGSDGAGDNNDTNDAGADEYSPAECGGGPSDPNPEHPGQYPCNFNAGPEAAGFASAYDLPNVVCVAASDAEDGPASFSNFGPTSVQVAAPGVSVLSSSPAYQSAFMADFEDPGFAGTWVESDGSALTNANWRQVSAAYRGSKAFSDSAVGVAYGVNANVIARTASSVAIPAAPGCVLNYMRNVDLEDDFDYLRVETAPDPGGPWTERDRITVWTGGDWYARSVPVPALEGTASYVRLRMTSDNSVQYDGVLVDDLSIRCLDGDYGTASIDRQTYGTHKYLSGTSMATPHVTGTAALVKAQNPGFTPVQLAERLVGTGDVLVSWGSRPIQSNSRLNVARALGVNVPQAYQPAPGAGGGGGTPVQPPADGGGGGGGDTGGGGSTPPPAPVRCVVPNLKGMKLADAEAALKKANCSLGSAKKKKIKKGKPGRVLAQNPAAGTSLAQGAAVAVTVGKKVKR